MTQSFDVKPYQVYIHTANMLKTVYQSHVRISDGEKNKNTLKSDYMPKNRQAFSTSLCQLGVAACRGCSMSSSVSVDLKHAVTQNFS